MSVDLCNNVLAISCSANQELQNPFYTIFELKSVDIWLLKKAIPLKNEPNPKFLHFIEFKSFLGEFIVSQHTEIKKLFCIKGFVASDLRYN
ncbi:hypothetical protein, partial [Idiomarina zobellii]|uniref:hypothetical protein n=1 Tax=Idiomarina zobellii TaxID=86103 RepID=UPI001F165CB1